MAASRQPAKNLDLIQVGNHRDMVVAELGRPVITEFTKDQRFDVFSFNNGYSNEANAARAAVHAGADILTLGLWEVIGTPSEALLQGNIKVVKVFYDNQNVVEKVLYYTNKAKTN